MNWNAVALGVSVMFGAPTIPNVSIRGFALEVNKYSYKDNCYVLGKNEINV